MGALGWLARRWFRRRWVAAVPVGLLVIVGGATTMIAIGAAERTSTAYDDYLERADVGDLVINPSVSTREISEVIAELPGVEHVSSDTVFVTTSDDGAPRTRDEVEQGGDVEQDGNSAMFVAGSHDGRYFEVDRPIVLSGRMPTGTSEAVATVDVARAQGLTVGDVVPLAFWQPGIGDGLSAEAYQQYATEQISPVGVERVEIVGIVRLADEVLPDDLYPRGRLIVSPEIAERYDCVPDEPPPGVTLAEAVVALLPPNCAVSYRYYSLALSNGAEGVKPALDQFVREAAEMNALFETFTDLEGSEVPSYFLIPTETDRERDRVSRTNRPIVTAALVLGLSAGAVTLVLLSLVVARELRRTADERRQWHRLGVGPALTTLAVAAPLLAGTLAGALGAGVLGWLFEPGPLGIAGNVEPNPERRLIGVAVLALGALVVLSLLTVLVLSRLATRATHRSEARRLASRPAYRVPVRLGAPVVTESVRSAFGQRAAPPVLAGITVVVTALVAALVFGTSLSHLLDHPREYGWPWDVAAMTGAGYGDLDLEQLDARLSNDPRVEDWTVLGFVNEIAIDGEPMMTLVAFDGISDVDLTVLDGELPRRADEVAVGAETAGDRGLEIGDTVQLDATGSPGPATITGIVVFPSLGPLMADRVGTGTGLLVPDTMFEGGLEQEALGLTSFVGVDLVDDDAETVAAIERELVALDMLGTPAFTYSAPIRPPEIIDAGATRGVPLTVALVLAGVAVAGVGFAAWSSVRSRRKELAVLRTLGFRDSQVRASIVFQSAATVLGGLVVGVPAGVIAGRLLWRGFADQLGVLPDPASPAGPVLIALIGGVLIAIAAAQVPALLATRSSPAAGLRAE